MAHVYDAQSLVDIPRLTAGAAVTVGTRLVAAADAEKKLAANVAAARSKVAKATAALFGSFQGKAEEPKEPMYITESRAEASSWSGLAAWLNGLRKMGGKKTDKARIAGELHGALFAEGLGFLRLSAAERWPETDRRLKLLQQPAHKAEVALLGGADALGALAEEHAAFGHAAGITTARPPLADVQLGKNFDAWKATARCYVLQVAANQSLDESQAAAALAERLLKPLTEIEPSTAAKPDKGAPSGSKSEKSAPADSKPEKDAAGSKPEEPGAAPPVPPASEPETASAAPVPPPTP